MRFNIAGQLVVQPVSPDKHGLWKIEESSYRNKGIDKQADAQSVCLLGCAMVVLLEEMSFSETASTARDLVRLSTLTGFPVDASSCLLE